MSSRVTRLSVQDFRSIGGRVELDLDAPVILLHGPNGSGKTSILSALELGLTGEVGSLQRHSKASYVDDLVHVGADKAIVRVERGDIERDNSWSEIVIQGGEIRGAPLLRSKESRFFVERCFLAQSILGRLLEIYEGDDTKTTTSPLTRFVDELLGLDVLENIIDGLWHVGDRRRLRKRLPLFADVEHRLQEGAKRVVGLQNGLKRAIAARQAAEEEVLAALSRFEDEPAHDLDAALERVKRAGDGTREVERLSGLRHEIIGALTLWSRLVEATDTTHLVEAERALRAADDDVQRWTGTKREILVEALNSARQLLGALPDPAVVGFRQAHETAAEAVAAELIRQTAQVERDRQDKAQIVRVTDSVERAKARARRLDHRIEALSSDADGLAKVLSELVQYVDDEICPVCGRDFSEVSSVPLRAHLTAHISSLAKLTSDLHELTSERQSVGQQIVRDERLVSEMQARTFASDAIASLTSRVAQLSEIARRLETQRSAAAEGTELLSRAHDAAAQVSEIRQQQASLESIRSVASRFCSELGLRGSKESESTRDTLERCVAAVERQHNATQHRRVAHSRAMQAVQKLEAHRHDVHEQQSELRNAQGLQQRTEQTWEKVEQTILFGRRLSTTATAARSSIVRRVFNESLNRVWRDLFVRLAPEEDFVPTFDLPDTNKGSVVARLSTVYRRTTRSGNPRSVLSAGNLNTAALTLFLSLHLSARPVLPWLVIDDPVQSMDEIHIAQFAALLRGLSRQCKRQTIIAVHERALFDYLALELSPAYDGDRLVTIELARGRDGRTECVYGMRTWEADSVLTAFASA